MNLPKIALIGSGNIGGTLAHLILQRNLGEVVLIDVAEGIPQGKALDLAQALSAEHKHYVVSGSQDYNCIKDADVVIVTAGIARKPGMSRDDLLSVNAKIICIAAENIRKYAPTSFVVVVTNPLDAMVWLMQKATAFKPNMVVGMAGVLDSGRFKCFLSEALNVSVQDIQTFVLGGHGDSMVPMPRYTTISGIPLSYFVENGWLSKDTLDAIINRTRNAGAEIVNLLKTGSAFYSPATSVLQMVESYLFDQRRILPCAAHLGGEYGVKDLYVGVPAIIGKNGVEKVLEIPLNTEEKKQLQQSVESVRSLTQACTDLGL
ncbi:MAG: malate dehydrogenase [Pseudomonadota bacterium]|nr:malate dehydrogenase [Alphaproteobacteria bacterium]